MTERQYNRLLGLLAENAPPGSAREMGRQTAAAGFLLRLWGRTADPVLAGRHYPGPSGRSPRPGPGPSQLQHPPAADQPAAAICPLCHPAPDRQIHPGPVFSPSNHTSSAFVLALTAFRLSAALGAVMLLLACLTGLSRISAGLHWPSDVAAGAALGICFGLLGLILF